MKLAAGITALVLALLVAGSAFVVNERELAVLFQFGAAQRSDFKPGLHFKLPMVQNVRKFDRRILTLDSQPERYLTAEKKDVFVDFFVKWRISDVAKYYTSTSGDELLATQRLSPIVRQALGREISERALREVVSGERSNLLDDLREGTGAAAAELGIEIVDIRISRIDLPDDSQVRDSVFNRMRAERKQVASRLRSEGTEAAERIRSDADRQSQVILAEANRDAQLIRGDGDAQAAQIYAKAYSTDPEFYAFHRSLEAYRGAFRDNDGVLVLDPKSEFFQYFSGERR
ncbi:MAG TPA: protease modulator HflC [Xanthomonadales bacterium]|nr:protease modulator HflC [Xanthomonadales bacterium]